LGISFFNTIVFTDIVFRVPGMAPLRPKALEAGLNVCWEMIGLLSTVPAPELPQQAENMTENCLL
jgi:hypothetical protein